MVDSGKQTQANSIGVNCKHYFPCDEGVAPAILTDIAGGVVIDPALETDHSLDTGAANTIRMLSFGTNVGLTGNLVAPGSSDVVLIACGKSRIDIGNADSDYGGFIAFYIGTAGDAILRVQPYYSTFYSNSVIDPAGTALKTIATPVNKELLTRNDGQDYIFAAVKRGNKLEHWADGIKTGDNDVTLGTAEMQTDWNNFAPGNEIRVGHGAYSTDIVLCQADSLKLDVGNFNCFIYPQHVTRSNGDKEVPGLFKIIDGNSNSAGEYAQDIYGLAVFVFEDGAPDDIGEAITWMKEQWVAGNKVIWPGWVSLK